MTKETQHALLTLLQGHLDDIGCPTELVDQPVTALNARVPFSENSPDTLFAQFTYEGYNEALALASIYVSIVPVPDMDPEKLCRSLSDWNLLSRAGGYFIQETSRQLCHKHTLSLFCDVDPEEQAAQIFTALCMVTDEVAAMLPEILDTFQST